MISKSTSSFVRSLAGGDKGLIEELTRLNECLTNELQKCHGYIEGLEMDVKEAQVANEEKMRVMALNHRYEGEIRDREEEIEVLRMDLDKMCAKLREKRHRIKQLEKSQLELQKSMGETRRPQENNLIRSSTSYHSHPYPCHQTQNITQLDPNTIWHRQTIDLYNKELDCKNMVIGRIQASLEEIRKKEGVIIGENHKLKQANQWLNQEVEELRVRVMELERGCDGGDRPLSLYGSNIGQIQCITSPKEWFQRQKSQKNGQRKVHMVQSGNTWPVTKRISAAQHQLFKQLEIQKQQLTQKVQILLQQRDTQRQKNQKIKNDLMQMKLQYSHLLSQKTKLVEQNVKLERKNSQLLNKLESFGTIKKPSNIPEDSRERAFSFRRVSKAHSIGSLTSSKNNRDGEIPVKDKNTSSSPYNSSNIIYLASSFSTQNAKKGSFFSRPSSVNCNMSLN